MPRSRRLARSLGFFGSALFSLLLAAEPVQAPDAAIWHEYGLQATSAAKLAGAGITAFRMQDPTGAIAAWEWQRQPNFHSCELADFCATNGKQTLVVAANYLLKIEGTVSKAQLDGFTAKLPERRNTSLPALINFVPRQNLAPNSARYVLGNDSFRAFAPTLAALNPGFNQGAEGQLADYRTPYGHVLHLALFYYPTPEMARIHLAEFRRIADAQVKRSGVLLALVYGGASEREAASLLSRVEYEAKVMWNDIPPPSPIKPLYKLILDIVYMSVVLIALCFVSGLIYAGIRLYRRRFGTLEEDEAMTTLRLSGH